MKNKKVYLILILSVLVVFFIIKNIIDSKVDNMLLDKYQSVAFEMKEQTRIMIDEKKNATLAIAMALAEDVGIKDALINDNFFSIHLDKFSQKLEKNSEFKNVWFQIVSNKGISKYRSWTKKRGDSLLKARLDVVQMIKTPKVMSTISTGKFDMTIKCLVPVYQNDKFLGSIEIITHFNSIYLNLLEKDIMSVLLVDKKYKKQLTHPFTKHFIGDYYVALLHTKQNFIDYIGSKGIEHFIGIDKEYYISYELGQLVTLLREPDIFGNNMGYFILFKDLKDIDMNEIENSKMVLLFTFFSIIVLLVIFIYFIISRKYIMEIKRTNEELKTTLYKADLEKNKTKEILNSLPNLIVLSNGMEMMAVSKSLMDFFDQFDSFEKLKSEYQCVCDFFLDMEDDSYIVEKEMNGETWLEFILKNKMKSYKACMKKNGIEHHFLIDANRTNVVINNEKMIVVSLTDITYEVKLAKELKIKEKMLYQQSKQASMGNLIGMIAHQWKQPLSVIAMIINNIKIDLEFESFELVTLSKELDSINENIAYMNTTINDFRNFFKADKVKSLTTLETVCEESLRLLSHSLKKNGIQLIKNYQFQKEIEILDNELKQIVLNLLNNAKDALKNQTIKDKVINIDVYEEKSSFVIKISDNGGGIPEEIIEQLGTMYFTTKEEGTGLGLYMSMMILKQQLGGKLKWYNTNEGACFEIYLHKDK